MLEARGRQLSCRKQWTGAHEHFVHKQQKQSQQGETQQGESQDSDDDPEEEHRKLEDEHKQAKNKFVENRVKEAKNEAKKKPVSGVVLFKDVLESKLDHADLAIKTDSDARVEAKQMLDPTLNLG